MRQKDSNNAAIGSRIKDIRTAKGITQEGLTEKLNLGSAQQISDIERGMCGIFNCRICQVVQYKIVLIIPL